MSIKEKFDIIYSTEDLEKAKQARTAIKEGIKMAWVCLLTNDKKTYHLELCNEFGGKIDKDNKEKAQKILDKL